MKTPKIVGATICAVLLSWGASAYASDTSDTSDNDSAKAACVTGCFGLTATLFDQEIRERTTNPDGSTLDSWTPVFPMDSLEDATTATGAATDCITNCLNTLLD